MPKLPIISALLTGISIHYKNEDYVGEYLMPQLPVKTTSGEYTKYSREDSFTLTDQRRGPKAQAHEVDWTASNEKYRLDDYALKDFVSDRDKEEAGATDAEVDTTDFLTDLIKLGREKRIATLLTDTSKMTNNVTLSGASQFSDYTESDPVSVLVDCRDKCFVPPNTMVIPQTVWSKMQFHPKLIKAVSPFEAGIFTLDKLKELLEIPFIYIARGRINTAAPGKPGNFQNVWGKDIVMGHVAPQPSKKVVSLGWDFALSDGQSDDGFEKTYRVRTWRDEATGGGGTWIEVEYSAEAAIVCPDVGYLVKNAVA